MQFLSVFLCIRVQNEVKQAVENLCNILPSGVKTEVSDSFCLMRSVCV